MPGLPHTSATFALNRPGSPLICGTTVTQLSRSLSSERGINGHGRRRQLARAPLREITEKDSAPSRLRCDHPVGMRETARRGCNVRGVKVLVSAIALALALAASAAAAPSPQQMLGTWTRTVTAADVQKAGATRAVAGRRGRS